MWPLARWAIGLALAGLAVWLVTGQTDELSGASHYLDHLRWWWLIAAVVSEAVSYLSFARMQRVLLRTGRVEGSQSRLTGVSLASTAMQNSLPAGAAFAATFAFRQYRRLGADDLLAGWVLVAGVALSFTSIAVLALVGLILALGNGSALGLVQAIGGTTLFALVVLFGWAKRAWILGHSERAVRLSRRLTGRPRGEPAEVVDTVRARLAGLAPSRRAWADAAAGAAGNWVFDLGALALAFLVVGVGVPWRGLLLAYSAGQLAALLPITPGGLGVVEGSLTVALVAFGGSEASAVAAVLVYRLVSFWGELPVGWAAAAVLTRWRVLVPHRGGDAPAVPEEPEPQALAEAGEPAGSPLAPSRYDAGEAGA